MNHLDLVDGRCYEVAAACLRLMQDRPDAVLAGGWAVYAHAPSVPSIDTDLILDGGLPAEVVEALEKEGIVSGPGKQVETISLGERFGYWAFGDEDLGIPLPGFVAGEVLEGRTMRMKLRLAGAVVPATVPTPGALALLKTCALHNRDLAYRSFIDDGTAGMHIGPQRMPMVKSLGAAYYLRKAGKDLFDLSLLLGLDGARDDLWTLARRFHLEEVLPALTASVDEQVRRSAAELAGHAGTPDPVEAVGAALTKP